MEYKESEIAKTEWWKHMRPMDAEAKSDPMDFKNFGKYDRILRQVDVAYKDPNATEQEILNFFMSDLKKMCIEDGWLISDEPNAITVSKSKMSAFGWTITLILVKALFAGRKDPYFGMGADTGGVQKSRFAVKGKRVLKPGDMNRALNPNFGQPFKQPATTGSGIILP